MKVYLYIAIGSALGGIARHWLTTMTAARFPGHFPWGTFAVNLIGSFLIGIIAALPEGKLDASGRAFISIGVLGGFTTFSAFSLQTANLFASGQTVPALLYVIFSIAACPTLAWLGWRIAQSIS